MKRVISIVTGAVLAVLSQTARAENPSCNMDVDAYCVNTGSSTEGSGNPLQPLTSKVPFQGIFAIGPNQQGSDPQFYLFLDGNDSLMDPLDGYVGLSTADVMHTVLGLVGDDQGLFTRGGPNRDLVDLLSSYAPTANTIPTLATFANLVPEIPSQVPDLQKNVLPILPH